MDKLYHIVGLLLLAALATGSLFAFVALNPQAFAEERQLGWCGTPDLPEEDDYLRPIRHPGRRIFNNNCVVCHSAATAEIVVGPSLKGVMQRREEPWVRQMIRDGQKWVTQKDPDALAQYREYANIVRPTTLRTTPCDLQPPAG